MHFTVLCITVLVTNIILSRGKGCGAVKKLPHHPLHPAQIPVIFLTTSSFRCFFTFYSLCPTPSSLQLYNRLLHALVCWGFFSFLLPNGYSHLSDPLWLYFTVDHSWSKSACFEMTVAICRFFLFKCSLK